MFGYITINQMELKIKDYLRYQSYYCGICQRLKRQYGQIERMVLSYDMTFVAMLLQGLYEGPEKCYEIRCPFHPLQKKKVCVSEASDYVADMNLLLAYYNLKDDWLDDHSVKSLISMKLLKRSVQKIEKKYPRQHKSVIDYMEALAKCEQKQERDNLDEAANLTGVMFAEIMVWKEDEWSSTLRNLGYSLGKFIYFMDAYDDLEKDQKSGSYNPLQSIDEEMIEEILKMLMAQVSDCFEFLPIIENGEILRNIIYAGVWMKYCQVKKKRQEKDAKASEHK